MAAQNSKRRSRKRRNTGGPPRSTASPRREQRRERELAMARRERRARRQLGTEGDRPPGPFGGVPVSEIAIACGLVALIVWFVSGGDASLLIVGIGLCAIGVVEVTGREHFSGYRSHATLLAAIPALIVGIGLTSLLGDNGDRSGLLLVIAAPVFVGLFWVLRKRFQIARQARVARPPAAPGAPAPGASTPPDPDGA